MVLTCVVGLEIEEEQLYSFRETKLVPLWKIPGVPPKMHLPKYNK